MVGPISKQALEMMRKRVQQFHHGLIVIGTGWREQEAHDDSCRADHAVQCVAKVLHGFAATHARVGTADKITGLFGPLVANTGDRRRVNGCRLLQLQRIEHDLQAHPNGQDYRPEIPLAASRATAFIESGEERLQTGLMQSEEVILSGFTDQFLIEGDGDQLAVRAGPSRVGSLLILSWCHRLW